MTNSLSSYFTGLFFLPTTEIFDTPENHNVSFEDVHFPALDGRRLHGYFFKPKTTARGTVVQCHGNAGNVTGHFSLMLFLVESGYNVLTFDYGGFGASPGKASPAVLVEDTRAALQYVKSRPDVDAKKCALFGQSLGGAPAAETMARDASVKCLILEGTFSSYRHMAWATGIGHFLFFLVPFVIPKRGPVYDLPTIAPRPVLIIHGTEDEIVPVKFAPILHAAAPNHSSLFIMKGFGHISGPDDNPDYRRTVLTFLGTHLI